MNDLAEMGVPIESIEVEADGVRLAVSREGDGPPIVCLHAAGHGARDFEAFADAIKARYEIVRIDWPGQGRSGNDRYHAASAMRYADLLADVLAKLQIHHPIIIGNSVGGAAAILYASRSPVRALVLCDTGGLVPINGQTRIFCSLFAKFFSAGARGAWWFKTAFALYYRLVLPSPAALAQRRRIVANAYQLAPILVQAWRSFARPEADLRPTAIGLSVPIWLAWAQSDRVIPIGLCMPAIKHLKNAELSIFPGGHAAFLEHPQAFCAKFEAFVDGLAPILPVPMPVNL